MLQMLTVSEVSSPATSHVSSPISTTRVLNQPLIGILRRRSKPTQHNLTRMGTTITQPSPTISSRLMRAHLVQDQELSTLKVLTSRSMLTSTTETHQQRPIQILSSSSSRRELQQVLIQQEEISTSILM